LFRPMLAAILPLKTGRRGRPRRRPDKAHGDKGYDYRKCRDACRRRRAVRCLIRRGVESKESWAATDGSSSGRWRGSRATDA
jgi:hypothetical protein